MSDTTDNEEAPTPTLDEVWTLVQGQQRRLHAQELEIAALRLAARGRPPRLGWDAGRRASGLVLGMILALVLTLSFSAVAHASVPGPNGIITACYQQSTGALRVIDVQAGGSCRNNELQLTWAQTGPAGPQGPQGPVGPAGPQGPAGPADTTADAFVNLFGGAPNTIVSGCGPDSILGSIVLLPGGTVSKGTALANGQLLPIDQLQELFSLYGTTFGGDGRLTFALPDLRAVAPHGFAYAVCVTGIFPTT